MEVSIASAKPGVSPKKPGKNTVVDAVARDDLDIDITVRRARPLRNRIEGIRSHSGCRGLAPDDSGDEEQC